MTTNYTAVNHQVFDDSAKVFCVCQTHDDALLVAQALNDIENSESGWRNSVNKIMDVLDGYGNPGLAPHLRVKALIDELRSAQALLK